MKKNELIKLLKKFPGNPEIIIHKDIDAHGFGPLERLVFGIYETTDYGNDFYAYQNLVLGESQSKAICLFPHEETPEKEELPQLKQ